MGGELTILVCWGYVVIGCCVVLPSAPWVWVVGWLLWFSFWSGLVFVYLLTLLGCCGVWFLVAFGCWVCGVIWVSGRSFWFG